MKNKLTQARLRALNALTKADEALQAAEERINDIATIDVSDIDCEIAQLRLTAAQCTYDAAVLAYDNTD